MAEKTAFDGIRAVVFDFDGTLAMQTLDFSHMRVRAVEALSRYADVASSSEEPMMEELERVCASLDAATAVKARQAAMTAIEEVEMEAARRSRLFPPVRPMLAALHQRGVTCAVISRNILPAIRMVFPDADEHFACILTRDDVSKVKPHPEHLLKALERINCPASQALMVGDHPMDIQVGKLAGSFTAGVAGGHVPLARLAEENPDWLAEDVGELMQMLGVLKQSPHG